MAYKLCDLFSALMDNYFNSKGTNNISNRKLSPTRRCSVRRTRCAVRRTLTLKRKRFAERRLSHARRFFCLFRVRLPDLGGNWNGTFYAVSQRYRPAAEYQPGYDGLPVGGTRVPPNTRSCESQGEWRSHSSGRRVVAASVLVSRRLAHDAGSRMKKCQVTFRKTPSKPARGQEV